MISDATIGSPLFVPDSLKFYVNRLAFSKNRVRLQALSSTEASSGSQVIVRLPSNTLVNLASLTMTGAVRAYFSSTPTADDGVALPTNYDFSFIETLSLIANGGIITQPFVNYKLLGTILNDVQGSYQMDQKRSALQGSLPGPIESRGTNAPADQGGWVPFSINNWISATQTMAPSYISTNLLGDLELRLTMADNSVVQSGSVSDGTAPSVNTAAWEMKNINFYIETAAIGNNLVDQAVAAKLAAGEPINVPFENVFSFSQTNNGHTFNQRFSVSSQSVNKILVTTQALTDIGSGQKAFVNGIPQALTRSALGATQAQFSVNNQYSPNYQIDSGNTGMYNPVTGTNNNNLQFSNALVETRAALDIPDYDYDCSDQLCSVPQMPMEYFGTGTVMNYAGGQSYMLQEGSDQIYEINTNDTPISPNNLTYVDTFPVLVEITKIEDPTNDQPLFNDLFNTTGVVYEVGDLVTAAVPTTGFDAATTVTLIRGSVQRKKETAWWYTYEHKPPINTYLNDKFVVATSFDFDVADKDRLVSGINTLGSNAQMFYNQVGTGTEVPNKSTIFVLCTSMVQIYAGATLKIVQ